VALIVHLRSTTVDVAVDVSSGVPVIRHWGAPLGSDDHVPDEPRVLLGGIDAMPPVSIVPMHGDGFPGRPGLAGHRRGGRHWAPRFEYSSHEVSDLEGRTELRCSAIDRVAELGLDTTLALSDDGVLTVRATVVNSGDTPFMLDSFSVSLPLPVVAAELAVFGGRWAHEFELHRFAWPYGAWTSENRTGRTSHEHPPFVWAMSAGAGEWSGAVWGAHVAWSGNHVLYAERLADGRRYLQLGALFHPGEMCVYAGGSVSTPDVIGVHSAAGLTGASQSFHREARRRLPRALGPRRVHLNTWEAVYFDHDEEKLRELVEVAAALGIERFVLDDGWFGGRRNDSVGLGDWEVSNDVYPNGLAPLIDHVRSLGMDFGIWVEPEMANPDSDVLRAHPEWIMATPGYQPVLGRRQVVLDLTRRDCFDHVLARLDALLSEHAVSYVKWDMNRPLVQASGADGKSSAHGFVGTVYELFDELRRRHPTVEFESCSSGGGRIDMEILRRVERFWTSDNNDAVDRQSIQRGASMVMPPEVLGAHVGPSPAHSTGRRIDMAFRTSTALFGHMGVEADVTKLSERDRRVLQHGIAVYKRFRGLLHGGDVVRFEPAGTSDGSCIAHGVYSPDRTEALVSFARLASSSSLGTPPLMIPGLIDGRSYRVALVPMVPDGDGLLGPSESRPGWLDDSATTITGRQLATVGLSLPMVRPETAVVVHLSCS
jgi:alpha-galactosidase